MNAPFVPPETVTSSAMKPVTSSSKVKVNVTGPLAVPAVSLVMVTVGPPSAATDEVANPTSAPSATTVAVAPARSFLRMELFETLVST